LLHRPCRSISSSFRCLRLPGVAWAEIPLTLMTFRVSAPELFVRCCVAVSRVKVERSNPFSTMNPKCAFNDCFDKMLPFAARTDVVAWSACSCRFGGFNLSLDQGWVKQFTQTHRYSWDTPGIVITAKVPRLIEDALPGNALKCIKVLHHPLQDESSCRMRLTSLNNIMVLSQILLVSLNLDWLPHWHLRLGPTRRHTYMSIVYEEYGLINQYTHNVDLM
jgi:hypothetical protein